MDFLKYIPSNVPEETILTSFDVQSLYTNIPHELGLQAIRYWLEKKPELVDNRFNADFIIESIKIVLEENTFVFDENIYRQIKGTAMGTKVAPSYANLVMGFLEQQMYDKIAEIFDEDFRDYIINNWKRYLDDCVIFWSRSKDDLKKFHELLNTLHPSIKFTMETSDTELPFLDILIKKSGTRIITDIYYKKTDTHQYLNFHSCHPSHTKRNIPYCMARRVCAIVPQHDIRNIRLNELRKFLIEQNYPTKLIDDGTRKAQQLTMEELRTPKNKQTDDKNIPFVCTNDPKLPNVFQFIRSNLPLLHQSTRMKELVPAKSLIYGRRQPKNLKKTLDKSEIRFFDRIFGESLWRYKMWGLFSKRCIYRNWQC